MPTGNTVCVPCVLDRERPSPDHYRGKDIGIGIVHCACSACSAASDTPRGKAAPVFSALLARPPARQVLALIPWYISLPAVLVVGWYSRETESPCPLLP